MSFGRLSCSANRGSRDLAWDRFGGSGGGREDSTFHSMAETQLSSGGGGVGRVNHVDQECLDGRFLVSLSCFKSFTDRLSPATVARSVFTVLIT
jgi:hypothetical protein